MIRPFVGSAWQSARTVATTLPYTTNPKPLTTRLRKDFAIADASAAIAIANASTPATPPKGLEPFVKRIVATVSFSGELERLLRSDAAASADR